MNEPEVEPDDVDYCFWCPECGEPETVCSCNVHDCGEDTCVCLEPY